ncbi:hypothetical protein Hesp01_60620 [Herbidospora sp. NBRC 101105]|nr:hypothetical protein Hesp01_60620 [Herbidospora sp. NBRC 101105]
MTMRSSRDDGTVREGPAGVLARLFAPSPRSDWCRFRKTYAQVYDVTVAVFPLGRDTWNPNDVLAPEPRVPL